MTAGRYAYPRHGLIGPGRPGRPRVRLTVTWLFAMLAAGGLVARLVTLQVTPSDRFIESGEIQRFETVDLVAKRGSIVDRNGADLALSFPQTSIVFDARLVEDPIGDAAKLAPILGADQAAIQGLLESGKSYVYLARLLDDATVEAVEALDLGYLDFISEDKRFLPSGDSFAASVIGRTDGYKEGISGLEKAYDELLSGTDGSSVIEQGAGGRTIPGGEQQIDPATPGSDVVLAMDRGLQFEVERLLMEAVDEAEARGGTVLVANPETGEVLVDANVVRPALTDPATAASTTTTAVATPQFGPAQPSRENRALSWTYEPGSINKVITMAAVLEDGLATPETVKPVSSSVEYIGKSFIQETRSTDEDLSLRQILARSDNVGTIMWAEQLGKARLDAYLRQFGLGSPTAIEWEHQSKGILPPLDKWSGTSLPTFAIGQGLAVTPMQMLQVYNAIANDGVLMPSRLVLGTETPDGEFTATPVPEPRRVVSEATSAALRDMLTSVVNDGTASRAKVDGYTVAGKTGTAWEPVPGGGYGSPGNRHLVTSFVGFLPASDPKLSIFVVIDDPANPYATGGTLAAPLFQKVAAYSVSHLRIPPDGETSVDGVSRVRAAPVAAPPTTVPQGTGEQTGQKPA